jgi:ABC-2 type transport system permease protein
VATSFGIGIVEFNEIYVIMHNVPIFGGLDFGQAALVFALANIAFSLADLVFGQLDGMPTTIRLGRLEVMLVRPMPLLAQLITADFQLRRLGRVAVGVVIAAIALPGLHISYTAPVVYLLIITPFVGAAIFGAFFTIAGGLQFFVVDGADQQFRLRRLVRCSAARSVLLTPFRLLFTFVFPATLVAYLPTLLILGLPGARFLPAWLGWLAPLFAVWIWVLAALVWRIGMRRLIGAGG